LSYFPLDETCGATQEPKEQEMEVLQDWLEESLHDKYKKKGSGNQVYLLGGEIESVVDSLHSIEENIPKQTHPTRIAQATRVSIVLERRIGSNIMLMVPTLLQDTLYSCRGLFQLLPSHI